MRLALRLQTHGKPDAYTLDRGYQSWTPTGAATAMRLAVLDSRRAR